MNERENWSAFEWKDYVIETVCDQKLLNPEVGSDDEASGKIAALVIMVADVACGCRGLTEDHSQELRMKLGALITEYLEQHEHDSISYEDLN